MTSALDPTSGYPVAYPGADRAVDGSCLVGRVKGPNAATKDESARGLTHQPERRRGRGPGRRSLSAIQRDLSQRDLSVLRLVDEHRFLTTDHIQRFCFTDHASPLSASRTCRRVLQRLERLDLLSRPVRRIGGLQAGSRSSVWMLTGAGRRLRNLDAGHGVVGRIREPGERFVAHYLAIAETRLQLLEAERAGQLELPSMQIEPRAWRSYVGLGGERRVLKPDFSAVTVAVVDGRPSEYEDHWFGEVDRGTESIPTLLGQCAQYEAYRRSGAEDADGGVFPLVLWIVPDERRRRNLEVAIARARQLSTDIYRVTTPERLIAVIRGVEP